MDGPLHAIRVLDLTRVLSGPFATQQLVDMGAEVIKVERPGAGDDTRRFGPPFLNGESTYFMSVNRAKKSVAIDLKHERGRALVVELAKQSDVVIENFKPGTAERLGLGSAFLREANPRLITCSISGYGSGGLKDFDGLPGYDAVTQAVTGLMALTGDPHGAPTKVGVAVSDMVAGLYATQGILSALFARLSGGAEGVGRHVEVSMQDAVASLLTYQAGIYFATGRNPARLGNAHPSICPYETVQTKDGIYALAVGNDAQFERFAQLLDLPELKDDARFSTNRGRVENREALMAILSPKLKEKTRNEWDEAFRKSGIPGGPVLEMSQALDHPQLRARGSVLDHEHTVAGTTHSIATPVRFDGQSPAAMPAAPTLGQHTKEVLQSHLGLDEAQVQELVDLKVIALA